MAGVLGMALVLIAPALGGCVALALARGQRGRVLRLLALVWLTTLTAPAQAHAPVAGAASAVGALTGFLFLRHLLRRGSAPDTGGGGGGGGGGGPQPDPLPPAGPSFARKLTHNRTRRTRQGHRNRSHRPAAPARTP